MVALAVEQLVGKAWREPLPPLDEICTCGHTEPMHNLGNEMRDKDICWGHQKNGHACDCRWLNLVKR